MRKIVKPCGLHCIRINHLGVTIGEQQILSDVNLHIHCGTLTVLIGRNGAGKSTLIKTIAGAIAPTGGEIFFKGEKLICKNPTEAIKRGIGVVYQEFNLFPNLTVYENIFFGIELKKNGFLDRKAMIQESKKILQ